MVVVSVLGGRVLGQGEEEDAGDHGGREDEPAELPPQQGPVADHVLQTGEEVVGAEHPRDGDGLEEGQPQQRVPTGRVRVQQREHVDAPLRDATGARQVRQ